MVTKGRSKERGEKARGSSISKSKVVKKCKAKCWYCNKIGHLKKDCWKWKESQNQNKEENHVDSGIIDEVLTAEALPVFNDSQDA